MTTVWQPVIFTKARCSVLALYTSASCRFVHAKVIGGCAACRVQGSVKVIKRWWSHLPSVLPVALQQHSPQDSSTLQTSIKSQGPRECFSTASSRPTRRKTSRTQRSFSIHSPMPDSLARQHLPVMIKVTLSSHQASKTSCYGPTRSLMRTARRPSRCVR